LIIVADGALQNIPFEALPLPESVSLTQPASTPRFLPTILLNNEVVYLPSASTMALLRTTQRRNFSKTLAVLADPVFDNSDARVRVNDRPPGPQADVSKGKLASSLRDIGDTADEPFALTKLEYSLKEANAIISVAPRGSWMKATGFKANRETATSQALKQFRMVHFATHGIINDRHPELSGVILSMVNERGQQEDGYLTLHDIYNLNLPVSLVVLSACRTGVGKHVKGEGVIGLTRGFMYAGAQRVVVSLWLVDDEATADLMKRFYRHMLGKNKLSASAALRRAKIEMAEANPQWRAPYYWAGFVLQGDWQ
jgi:CHAT domain-containing protein